MNKPIFTTRLRKMQIAIGVIGLIFFATADLLQGHQLSVGLRQLAGLTVSAIIILAGISNHLPWERKTVTGGLFLLYLGGILFMGLYPHAASVHRPGVLLGWGYSYGDVIINVLGFVPLGFLAMGLLAEMRRTGFWQSLGSVVAFCLCVSLAIELVQYFLPGRSSSMVDLLTNTLGALVGATLSAWEIGLESRHT
jgi:VanZ family protein